METRTVTEIKNFSLHLNPITANWEATNLVAIAYTRESLDKWYKEQLSEKSWEDGGFIKFFKKGSKLEMYNPISENPSHSKILERWSREDAIELYIHQAKGLCGFTEIPILIDK